MMLVLMLRDFDEVYVKFPIKGVEGGCQWSCIRFCSYLLKKSFTLYSHFRSTVSFKAKVE